MKTRPRVVRGRVFRADPPCSPFQSGGGGAEWRRGRARSRSRGRGRFRAGRNSALSIPLEIVIMK